MVVVELTPIFTVACGLLVVAGAAKLRMPLRARASLGLLGARVPAPAVRSLGAGEVAIGVIAVVWPGVLTGALVALAYGAFCAFLGLVLVRAPGLATDCGCFGDASASAGASHLALNAVACGAGVLAAVDPPPGLGWVLTRPPLIALPLSIGICAAAFAAYLAFTVFPRVWRAYGSGVGA